MGLPAIAGVATEGFFTRPRLSGEGQRALEFLRAAAIDPAHVTSTSVGIDELIMSGSTVQTRDSLRYRLGRMQARATVQNAADATTFCDLLGVSRDGFVEARDYLREEIRAFDRSRLAELPAETLPDGTTTATAGMNFTLYGATRNPPEQLHPAYWGAVLRHDASPPQLSSQTNWSAPPAWDWRPDASGRVAPGYTYGDEAIYSSSPPFVTGFRSVAAIIDEGVGRIPTILNRLCPTTCTGTLQVPRDILAGVPAEFVPTPASTSSAISRYDASSYLGRARVCLWQNGPGSYTDLRFDVQSTSVASTGVRIAIGRDGLDCAVTGLNEGVPCSQATFNTTVIQPQGGTWTISGDTFSGYSYNVEQKYSTRPTGANSVTVFLVRPRVQTPAGGAPGQYEPIVGWILPAPTPTTAQWRFCESAPITPRLEREAAALIQPDPENPYGPAQSCAGLPSDMRIPLENELTDDGNGIESSWRHYLELARRAAEEADALGEDLIRTGLEMDLRAESATDELSRLCGTSINLTSISDSIAADAASVPAVGSGPPCTPGSPYVEQRTGAVSRCVLDPVLYAAQRATSDDDMARLSSCIGADIVQWATYGDTQLCIWDANPTDPSICEGSSAAMPCPYEALAMGSCGTAGVHYPVGASTTPVTERMGIFQRPTELPPQPPDPTDLPCAELAAVRNGTATDDQRTRLMSSALLTFDGMAALAEQLTWEAQVGDYSAVRYGNSRIFHTGSITSPPTSMTAGTWPMGPAPTGACPGTAASDPSNYTGPLFCLANRHLTGSGSTGAQRIVRARMNDLLARAVLAARIYSGNRLSDIMLPYYARTAAHQYVARQESISWDALGGGGSAYAALAGEFTIDHFTSGDTAGPYARQISDLGSQAYTIQDAVSIAPCGSSIPVGVEWATCPYDAPSCVEMFDDNADCDDPAAGWPGSSTWDFDRNAPFLVRAADDGLSRSDAELVAERIWREALRGLVDEYATHTSSQRRAPVATIALPDGSEVGVDQLSNYFDSWADSGLRACRLEEYEECMSGRPERRLLEEGNRAFIARDGLTEADLLNGIELACWSARSQLPTTDTSCAEPTGVTSVSDAFRIAQYFECRANELSLTGANTIARDLPRRVVDALRQDGPGLHGTGTGEFDAQVSEIRAALIDLSNIRSGTAADMRAFASRVRILRSTIATSQRARRIEALTFAGRALDRYTGCISAIAEAATCDPAAAAGKSGAAAATCVNAVGQIFLDTQIQQLRGEDIEDQIISELEQFNIDSAQFSRSFAERSTAMRSAFERIDAALSRLHETQQAARRALARALLLDGAGTASHNAVNTAYRARYSTLLQRYHRAHTRAIRAAYIARLALEQRIGMPLDQIEDDLFSDEPPREWVHTICTLPSIDYDRIRGVTGDPEFQGPDDYSGAYVGDYVRRLEDVFESYSFVYPFREGPDTAVISLRDDIFRVRAPCATETPNLLYNGGNLDVQASSDLSGRPGWFVSGCAPSGTTVTDRSCVSATRLETAESTVTNPAGNVYGADFGRPTPYRVSFGGSATTTSARLEQQLLLQPGRYRVSWFARTGPLGNILASRAMTARDRTHGDALLGPGGSAFGEDLSGVTTSAAPSPACSTLSTSSSCDQTPGCRWLGTCTGAGWRRYWYFFDLASPSVVGIYVDPGYTTTVPARDVDLAGVMLEDVTGQVEGDVSISTGMANGTANPPPSFFETGDLGLRELRTCSDGRGAFFRREAWERGCARTCIDGYDGRCPEEWEDVRCYWQTSVDISSDRLQQLLVESDAGFAAGNFNYRIESVAVNLVGTGLRDCSSSGTSGCYGSGNLPFSMLHIGPFLVRNARGRLYDAPIFPGRIESARALAAERYISNPISGADQALIEPYTRRELQGRPLGGTLVLRLWDCSVPLPSRQFRARDSGVSCADVMSYAA